MRTLGLEMRYAVRSILKRPAMSAIVVITLALGLGANAAIFSMIDALVLRPFTMPDVDRITLVSFTKPRRRSNRREALSPADFLDFEGSRPTRSSSSRRSSGGPPTWSAATSRRTCRASSSRPTSSRRSACSRRSAAPSCPTKRRSGRHRRVVLGHGLWQRRFASDPCDRRPQPSIRRERSTRSSASRRPASTFRWASQIWAPLSFNAEAAANRRVAVPDRSSAGSRPAARSTTRRRRWRSSASGSRAIIRRPIAGAQARVYTLGDGMMDIGLVPILSMWQASALFRAAHRLRERREPAAGPRRRAAARDGRSASRSAPAAAASCASCCIESGLLALVAVPAALASRGSACSSSSATCRQRSRVRRRLARDGRRRAARWLHRRRSRSSRPSSSA